MNNPNPGRTSRTMTENSRTYSDAESERIIAEGVSAAERLRQQIAAIEAARDSQPERLAMAQAAAAVAREDCLAIEEERWDAYLHALPGYTRNADGGIDMSTVMFMPHLNAKGVFGTRLAFDLLSNLGDEDAANEVLGRYFAMTRDTGDMFLLCAEALKTIAVDIAPNLMRLIEECGNDYNMRVALADTARIAWEARIAELEGGA